MSHSLVISPREIELKEVSLKDGTAVGLITTDTVDRYREIVDPGGAQLEHFRRNPVVLLNHNSWGVPIGKNLWTKNEGRGILAKTQFAPTPEGRDVLALYEGGFMKAWSIGFIPRRGEDSDPAPSGYRRKHTQWELLEYSAVTIPANPDALTNALDRMESDRMRELLEREINNDQLNTRVNLIETQTRDRIVVLETRTVQLEAQLEELRQEMAIRAIADPDEEDEDESDLVEKEPEPTDPASGARSAQHPSLEMSATRHWPTNAEIAAIVVETLGDITGLEIKR